MLARPASLPDATAARLSCGSRLAAASASGGARCIRDSLVKASFSLASLVAAA
jgi:hypothetical protein